MNPANLVLGLLLVLLLILGVGVMVVLVTAAWTSIKIALWESSRRAAEQEARRRKFQPDGTPYPPAARGICDQCSQAFEEVYHLPAGGRLCRACFDHSGATGEPPTNAG